MVHIQNYKLQQRLLLALNWLTDVALKKEEQLTNETNPQKLEQKTYKGAIKNAYFVASKTWQFQAPVWHTAQAIKAMVAATKLEFADTSIDKKKYLTTAEECASFILKNQIWDKKNIDHGLILAFEDMPGCVSTAGILETVDALFVLSEATGNEIYRQRALEALKFCKEKLYVRGEGLFVDGYDYKTHKSINPYSYDEQSAGRPLNDDAVYLKAWKLTKISEYRTIFYEILEKLTREEDPPGNWIKYHPSHRKKGFIHARQAFWWSLPFVRAYEETSQIKFLDVAKRAGEWYLKAIRADGGIFRNTYADFNTDSFGHATSGAACAVILWCELKKISGLKKYDPYIRNCLNYCLNMQFTFPKDKNLFGCVLEKVLPPDGTDGSPYLIRDLGTIFFAQAVAKYFENF